MSPGADPAVARIVDAGGPQVPRLLALIEETLAQVAASYGPVLAAHAGATIAAGGKRLRPLLVILAAGPAAPDDAVVRAAAAVELIHSASLVHDDVLDGASLRRGRPTVVAEAGRTMATAVGDFVFSRAFALLVANEDPDQIRALSRAASALSQGELVQRADAWNAAVPVERYLRRCELKTATLFEAACDLGTLAARSGVSLGDFGRRIGLAFQLLDDVLDVSGPAERIGKHRGTDLLDGTITLPFILARAKDPGLAALEPRSIVTPDQAADVCDAIAATGALEEARSRALDIVAAAKAGLPDLPQRRALELVADSVVERYS